MEHKRTVLFPKSLMILQRKMSTSHGTVIALLQEIDVKSCMITMTSMQLWFDTIPNDDEYRRLKKYFQKMV